MADFYSKMQGIASDLLTRFNQGIIHIGVVTKGTGPANNPGPSTTVWTLTKGAAIPNTPRGSNSYEDGTLIRVGDLKVTTKVEALAADPKAGDLIRFGGDGGQQYRVIQFNKVPATGIVAAWVFYVRRG